MLVDYGLQQRPDAKLVGASSVQRDLNDLSLDDPDADAAGYVSFPNVNPIEESVNLMEAARSYQMNVSAIQTTKAMIQAAIQIAQ